MTNNWNSFSTFNKLPRTPYRRYSLVVPGFCIPFRNTNGNDDEFRIYVVKQEGKKNDLIERICRDESFGLSESEIRSILKPENFVGLSSDQVDDFLQEVVRPILDNDLDISKINSTLTV